MYNSIGGNSMVKIFTDCLVEYIVSLFNNKRKIITIKGLKNDDIVSRKVYLVLPTKVENSLTNKGNDFKNVVSVSDSV